MPCLPVTERCKNGKHRQIGFLCVGNEPIKIQHNGKTYLFEWGGCGWMPVNKDGSERLSRVPNAVWDKLAQVERPKQ